MSSAKAYLFFSLGCAVLDRETHIHKVVLYCRRAAEKASLSLTSGAFQNIAGEWLSEHGELSSEIKRVLIDASTTVHDDVTGCEMTSLQNIADMINPHPNTPYELLEMIELFREKVFVRFNQMDEQLGRMDEKLNQMDDHVNHADTRFDEMHMRFEELDEQIVQVDDQIRQLDEHIDDVQEALSNLDC